MRKKVYGTYAYKEFYFRHDTHYIYIYNNLFCFVNSYNIKRIKSKQDFHNTCIELYNKHLYNYIRG